MFDVCVYTPHFFSPVLFSNRLPKPWKTPKALKSAIAVAPLRSTTPFYKGQRAIVKVVDLTFAPNACAATTTPVTVWATNQWNLALSWGHFLGLRKAKRIYGDCDPPSPICSVLCLIKVVGGFKMQYCSQRKSNKEVLSAVLFFPKGSFYYSSVLFSCAQVPRNCHKYPLEKIFKSINVKESL